MQRLRAQMDELSLRYVRNLNDDSTFLLFSESDLVGLPLEFIKVDFLPYFFVHFF